jgi:hypothetical protein
MENRKTILEELRSLSPYLAENQPGHPYTVPVGYFEGFPGTMVEQLSGSVLAVPHETPMQVPAGYFDGVAASILARIKQAESVESIDEESEVLARIGKKMPYEVPAGYFEQLSTSIESVYWNESAPNILTVINRKNPFMVPDGYFEQLPSQIKKAVHPVKPQAALYSIGFVRKVYRYAAAAILVGIVSVAALMYLRTTSPATTVAQNTAVDINNISIDELQNYLSGQEAIESDNLFIATNGDLEAGDLKEFLNDMPEATLQKYVQDYAQPNTN